MISLSLLSDPLRLSGSWRSFLRGLSLMPRIRYPSSLKITTLRPSLSLVLSPPALARAFSFTFIHLQHLPRRPGGIPPRLPPSPMLLVHSREHDETARIARSTGLAQLALQFPDLVIRESYVSHKRNRIPERANPLTLLTMKAASIDALMRNGGGEGSDWTVNRSLRDIDSPRVLQDRPRAATSSQRRAINTRFRKADCPRVYTHARTHMHVQAYFFRATHNYRLLIPELTSG